MIWRKTNYLVNNNRKSLNHIKMKSKRGLLRRKRVEQPSLIPRIRRTLGLARPLHWAPLGNKLTFKHHLMRLKPLSAYFNVWLRPQARMRRHQERSLSLVLKTMMLFWDKHSRKHSRPRQAKRLLMRLTVKYFPTKKFGIGRWQNLPRFSNTTRTQTK